MRLKIIVSFVTVLTLLLSQECIGASFEVSPDDDIQSQISLMHSGDTLLFQTGTYQISSSLYVLQEGITLTSKARHRDSVILDGNGGGTPLNTNNFTNAILTIRASNCTVSHISITHARHHGIHIYPQSTAIENNTGILLDSIRVYDCSQQLIKVNSNGNNENLRWVDEGVLANSLIEFTDNSVMEEHSSYFYTGGIDVHGGRDWVIKGNRFRNIEREGKLMEHAVHFWSKSRGTVVENNIFHNVYRAIGFGMKTEESGSIERHYEDALGDNPYFDHIGGIIRNNVLYNEGDIHLETGIELSNVYQTEVYHNSIFSEDTPFNSMEYRWPNTEVTIKNNLCSHQIMQRNSAQGTVSTNLENVSASLFNDVTSLDFHLRESATEAIGAAEPLPDSLFGFDMDGQKASSLPDIGADQTTGVSTVSTGKEEHPISMTLSSHSLTVSSPVRADGMLAIHNLQGKQLYKKRLNLEGSLSIPVELAVGSYVVSLGTKEQHITNLIQVR